MASDAAPRAERPGPPEHRVEALADRIERAARLHPRYLLGLAGSPGGGKTTLAAALVAKLNARHDGIAASLPMDGFHLANATLDRLSLRGRKGAIETFDGWGFVALLDRVRRETDHTVYAPTFPRRVDEGVAGAIAIEPTARIVIVEGNYLLIDREPWYRVRGLLDEAWFCSTPAAERESRLIDRHTRHGRTPEAAAAWARDVDGGTAALIEASRARADLLVSGITGEPIGEPTD